jgi:F0F1-type ATP synthase membrane subunit a
MKLIKLIFQIPYILYCVFPLWKLMYKNIKESREKGELKQYNINYESIVNLCQEIFEKNGHLEKHICWIFWITLSLFITIANT